MKVFDRDGKERGETVKGDMYIRDLRNTKGHVSPCTFGQWHPNDRYLPHMHHKRQKLMLSASCKMAHAYRGARTDGQGGHVHQRPA